MGTKFKMSIKTVAPFTKIMLIFVLIVLCLTLTACDPGSFCFTREYLSDIVCVELIDYNNPNQEGFISWVPDHTADLKPFEVSKFSVLETLDEDKISDFIDDLCRFNILDRYYAYDSPRGVCVKLSYAGGDFVIVSSDYNSSNGYIGKFYADGEVAEFIGCFSYSDDFETLVNSYFQTKIFGLTNR